MYIKIFAMKKVITLSIFILMIIILLTLKANSSVKKTSYFHHPKYIEYVTLKKLAIHKNVT